MSRPAAITTLAALATSAVFVTWFVSCYLLIYVLLLSFGEGLLRQLAVGMFLASPVFVIWLVYAVIRYGRMRTRAADQQRGKDHNQDAQKSRIKLHTHRILQRFMVGNAILGSITDQPGSLPVFSIIWSQASIHAVQPTHSICVPLRTSIPVGHTFTH